VTADRKARRARWRTATPREPVREAARSLTERLHPGLLLVAVLLLSGAGHMLALSAAARVPVRVSAPPPPRVRVTVVEAPVPPKPEAEPPPPKPLAMARQPRRLPTPPTATPPPPPVTAAPPPPTEEAPAPSDVPPVVIPGAALSATTRGSVAVGAGNTMRGPAANAPVGEARPYRAAEYAEAYALSESPVFLHNLSDEQVRSFYPQDARKAGVSEARVRTKLLVDGDGSVAQVTVLSDPGHGFGAAAAKVARLYRFKPGKINGKPVATEIVMSIIFELM
jgi:periplasmic protein TonB